MACEKTERELAKGGGEGVQKGSPVSAYVFIRNTSAATTNQKLQDTSVRILVIY